MRVVITGLDEVYAKLEKAKNVHEAVLEGIREVLEEARSIVEAKYSLRGSEGNTNYVTTIDMQPNGGTLTVSGDDVGFLEFGAGVFTDESNVFVNEVDYPVYAGSWSENAEHSDNPNARYFAKNGFWWWSGIRYTGLAPTRGMQTALEEVRNTIEKKIEEKISQWID